MTSLRNLTGSKRGMFCVLVLVLATVLTLVGIMTGTEWSSLAKFLTATLVTAHTISGASTPISSQPTQVP